VFGCTQAPQFSIADLGTRPAHSYLQFNTAAVKHWRWGDLEMKPAHSYLQFNTAAVKHWRWGDLFVCELLEINSRPQTTASVQQGISQKTRSYTVKSTFTLKLATYFMRSKNS